MRRLDGAILELGAQSDRDKILDIFFDYGRSLFEFSVFFVVRGDSAHGRNVAGLGAPEGLVTRLAFPLNEPGVLSRARELRKAFVAPGCSEEADRRLFGNLGRALPAPLVVPLVVRNRVIGIFIGETPADVIAKRASESGRSAMDLIKDEMVLLAESTGQVLERLILRRKNPDSAPPPAPGAGVLAPPNLGPIPHAPPLPIITLPPAVEPASTPTPETAPPSRRTILIGAVAAAVAIASIGAWWLMRADTTSERVIVAGTTLRGWPREVEPLVVLDSARKAAQISAQSELGLIEAEVGPNGRVDFSAPVKNPMGVFLRFVFLTENAQTDITVDGRGVRPPHEQPRQRCGEAPCLMKVPLPRCTFPQVIESSRDAGVGPNDRALIKYSASSADPEWLLSVAGRGSIRLDAETCRPLPREKLRPPPLPLEKIPGAPSEVDPLGIIAVARTQSGLEADAVLLEIEARGVGDKGRVDLKAPGNGITYVFAEPLGQKRRRWRQVVVRPDGMPTVADEGDQSPLPVRLYGPIVPTPRCSFAQAREYLTRGIANASAARMTYGPDFTSGQGGQWTFELASLPARRMVGDVECEAFAKMNSIQR